MPIDKCIDCGNALTEEERHYYEYRCEGCEVFRHERIQAWRRGSIDPELDNRNSAFWRKA